MVAITAAETTDRPPLPPTQAQTTDRATVPITRAQVRDVDGYRGAVAGVDIEAIRVGHGSGSNSVLNVVDDDVTVTAVNVGFPILSRTTTADDRVIIAVMRSAPPGSRWTELDLRGGQTLVYGPGVEHTATNKEGLSFAFAVTTRDRLRARAEELKTTIDLPGHGDVYEIRRPHTEYPVTPLLQSVGAHSNAASVAESSMQGLLSSMALAFSPADEKRRPRDDVRRLDSRRIVSACIDVARSMGRAPAIVELCAATHVSERRLREAFVSVYDMPPSAFFRARMLAEAHERLVRAVPSSTKVSSIALDVGFDHLGRFARRYEQVYGQLPSVTLRDSLPTFRP